MIDHTMDHPDFIVCSFMGNSNLVLNGLNLLPLVNVYPFLLILEQGQIIQLLSVDAIMQYCKFPCLQYGMVHFFALH